MNKVTDIQIQVKRRNRYSVFLDDEFAFGLDQDVLIKSGIARGDELTEDQIKEILTLEAKKGAKDKAMRLLAARARSIKEMRDKLKQAKFPQDVIDWVIDECTRLGLLNDVEFAVMFARNRMITRPEGEYLLRQELKLKGLSDEAVQKGVETAFEEISESDFAEQTAIKAKRKYKNMDDIKARKKTTEFLLRRGFSWDIVNDIMENWERLKDIE